MHDGKMKRMGAAMLGVCLFAGLAACDDGKLQDGDKTEYKADVARYAVNPRTEATDALCSDGVLNFKPEPDENWPFTWNDGMNSWYDCNGSWCKKSLFVSVCNALENTDAACSDGLDNPRIGIRGSMGGNGLVDCDDPSCFKNPAVTVCRDKVKIAYELGAECLDGQDNDGDGKADCEDLDCLHAGGPCELGTYRRVLFDNAHNEQAGNADWVVDITGRHPWPTVPAKEDDWAGALSSWGKALIDTGHYVVETLIQDRAFTYGTDNPQDLKNYHVLVIDDPSIGFALDEKNALKAYVENGGGLFLISDHLNSDRDANFYSAVRVFEEFIDVIGEDTLGFKTTRTDEMGSKKAVVVNAQHPVLAGRAGNASDIEAHAYTTFEITDPNRAEVLLTIDNAPYLVSAQVGKGRVLALGDSAITGDNTDSFGYKNNHNGFNENDHKILLLNAIDWLAGISN